MATLIEFPWYRVNYDWAMEELADEEVQRLEWPIPAPYNRFDLLIHIIFDDMNIEESKGMAEAMGLTHGQHSAALAVMQGIQSLWQQLSPEASPELLRSLPGWKSVVSEAQKYLREADPVHVEEMKRLAEEAKVKKCQVEEF